MITSAMQLKAKIRNLARDSNAEAHDLATIFMLERFLERITVSEYAHDFILKGGMLLTSMLGIDNRMTADMDVTLNGETLSIERTESVLQEISAINVDDNVSFEFHSLKRIMETRDYPGIQAKGSAKIDKMVIPVKLDISTGDVITPAAIEYSYPLMFEDRSLNLQTYDLETVLAEKLIALAGHGIGNSRMRDFYDMHVLLNVYGERIDPQTLANALTATAKQRRIEDYADRIERLLPQMENSPEMQTFWKKYGRDTPYASNIAWPEVLHSAGSVLDLAYPLGFPQQQTKPESKQLQPKQSKRKQQER